MFSAGNCKVSLEVESHIFDINENNYHEAFMICTSPVTI